MVRKRVASLMLACGLFMSLVTPTTFANAAEKVSVGNLIRNNTFDNGVGLPWNQVETYPADADFDIEHLMKQRQRIRDGVFSFVIED